VTGGTWMGSAVTVPLAATSTFPVNVYLCPVVLSVIVARVETDVMVAERPMGSLGLIEVARTINLPNMLASAGRRECRSSSRV